MTNKRVYSGRPATDGSYMFYLPEGTIYEMDVDPEQSKFTFFSKVLDLTSDKIAQKERVNIVLRQPVAGSEIPLDMVTYKADTDPIDVAASDELKRLIRVSKANPQLRFEIQVAMTGYLEDSIQSHQELTEVRMDSIRLQHPPSDSASTTTLDSVTVRKVYHNDRTPAIAQRIIDHALRQGGDPQRFTYKAAALPATVPGEKKLVVKAVVR